MGLLLLFYHGFRELSILQIAIFSSTFLCKLNKYGQIFPKNKPRKAKKGCLPLEGKGDRLRWMRCRMRSIRSLSQLRRATPPAAATPHPIGLRRPPSPQGEGIVRTRTNAEHLPPPLPRLPSPPLCKGRCRANARRRGCKCRGRCLRRPARSLSFYGSLV